MSTEPEAENELWMDPALFPFMSRLAPGVIGSKFDRPGEPLVITTILAEQRGNGDVSRFLDTLPRDREVRFPTVINPRLRGMLERRGFTTRWDPSDDGPVEWFVRREAAV